tara:strand:+ start:243 stop:1184 length:942 start_codon:yes stop_codon:yes gene_type:complete
MLGSTFYHQTIRKYVAAFGTLFNDINIERKNSSGTVIERVKVPLAYGPRQKWILALSDTTDQRRVLAARLPRIGFALTGVNYDSVRKLNTVIRNVAANTASTGSVLSQYNPVPYNFDFELFILVNNAEDGTQILEQILPYFTPEFTVTINTIPDMGIKADVPIVLNSASQSDEYEGELATRRTIIWTLSFLLKGFVYPDVKSGTLIKSIEVNFRIPGDGDSDVQDLEQEFIVLETTKDALATSDYILLETGDYERIMSEKSSQDIGDATVKSRYTVVPSPNTAQADSDYGFSETFEFFDNPKNFDPETGEDFT